MFIPNPEFGWKIEESNSISFQKNANFNFKIQPTKHLFTKKKKPTKFYYAMLGRQF